jgi:hypothetical protein
MYAHYLYVRISAKLETKVSSPHCQLEKGNDECLFRRTMAFSIMNDEARWRIKQFKQNLQLLVGESSVAVAPGWSNEANAWLV